MDQVMALAALRGWKAWHDTDSRRNAAGFPDLVLLRDRVVWAELKSERGRLRDEQARFLTLLRAAGQEVYVWRPSDWDALMGVLA